MYIHRVVLKDVPGIPDHDLTFFDQGWTEEPLKHVLLTGPNGSGKTAILRTITSLWDYVGGVLRGDSQDFNTYDHTFKWGGLVTIEIREFLDKPLWVFSALSHFQDTVSELSSGSLQAGLWHDEQGEIIGKAGQDIGASYPDESRLAQQLRLGSDRNERLPNMIFMEAEGRRIRPQPLNTPDIGTELYYRWLTTYDEQLRAEALEIKLRYLKIRNEQLFQTTIEHINKFLRQNDKEIVGFDSSLRLEIKTTRMPHRGLHYIHNLSSGEQQCLILIYMVSRWLMPGGVVLLDEPDLHIHVGWQRQLIHHLKNMVDAQGGQMIVASHSRDIWQDYTTRQRIELATEVQA